MALTWQQPLPPIYRELSDAELRLRITEARERLGDEVVILGHHYQQDDVIDFADVTGDSFELSRKAADRTGMKYVVFCGVHFMAETADILTDESVSVILPDLGAGCSMADMANLEQTEEAWEQLTATCGDQRIVPVTYMNSSAAIKAFVGEHGGAVCTSSNARTVLEWALGGRERDQGIEGSRDQGADRQLPSIPRSLSPSMPSKEKTKVLFFPDQHLGRNTAYAMGYPLDRMVVWDPRLDLGGNSEQAVRDADFVLWKGHCSVHALFRPEHVDQARARRPDIKVIVHPECKFDVVQKADMAGSTAYIVQQIEAAEPGSQWAIGTEVHLVNRLKHDRPDLHIEVLSDCQCLCTTMFRIDLPHLCWILESLVAGEVKNEIKVDSHTRKWALVALERMLKLKGTGNPLNKRQPVSASID